MTKYEKDRSVVATHGLFVIFVVVVTISVSLSRSDPHVVFRQQDLVMVLASCNNIFRLGRSLLTTIYSGQHQVRDSMTLSTRSTPKSSDGFSTVYMLLFVAYSQEGCDSRSYLPLFFLPGNRWQSSFFRCGVLQATRYRCA